MKKLNRVLWGLVLVALGVVLALNALEITDISLFFDGWWTLFIIIPSLVGLFTEPKKGGNLICLLIGVTLLLCCREVLSFDLLWKLAVPSTVVYIGAKMIFGSFFDKKTAKMVTKLKENDSARHVTAVFSGDEMKFAGERFDGATLTAVFGGVDCDLTGALIAQDCVIDATAVFGGIDIKVPAGIAVKTRSTSLFGGLSNKAPTAPEGAPTLYVNATCLFGGVEVK